ncbi:MAG TPA: hypothetical protein VGX91_13640 [Candidatus Cybelea sp.]|jgi:hypothetical protein|nr:hypothetical protein [Candidatus Cybelea sp.]
MSTSVADNYAIYYADKLWNLLPAVYREQDADQFFDDDGPLREMVNRIGATAAELRRSIDRLWEDQSIETCDDWVIPYIATLLDTHLVIGLDARGQRLDVANTIDYRRRKGTLSVLEQIASDITGWDAKAVEFFRRLGRTRHGLDPAIGPGSPAGSDVALLQQAEGLVGNLTGTRAGGFADLRNVYGAGKSRTAFDEFFHTADTRAGEGLFGWQAIPHLGIFVWRLLSLGVGPVTPVAVTKCPGCFCFDPTGRNVPLFALQRGADAFGDNWTSPSEGNLPGPISQSLLDADIALGPAGLQLYPVVPPPSTPSPPSALSVSAGVPPFIDLVPAGNVQDGNVMLRPERGQFAYFASPPTGVVATYHYGFPSLIGAGPYDRRGQMVVVPTPAPPVTFVGGGTQLTGALPHDGTVTLGDSLTYTGAGNVHVWDALTLRADNGQRPLLRLGGSAPWVIHGHSGATLALDGIFVSGGDIVLRGNFSAVTLTCCTLDPGSAATDGADLFQHSADERPLRPTRLWIEADVTSLSVDRCVLGPIRTRGTGTIETTTITNTILQAIRTSGFGAIVESDVKDPTRLLRVLQLGLDPVSAMLRSLDPGIEALLGAPTSPPLDARILPLDTLVPLLTLLKSITSGPSLFPTGAFVDTPLSNATSALLAAAVPMQPAPALNRLLLEDAYPLELADAAAAFGDGSLSLSRCTLLGRLVAHQLDASECILQDLAEVDDLQQGCVRFTAWATGSTLPRQYESVTIAQAAPLFTTTDFGQPGYAQLLPTVDLQILSQSAPTAASRNTISAGAADGSEMGAYARDKNPIRAQALLLKLQEYMPASLVPVIVDVT